jgi:hypothetical protein
MPYIGNIVQDFSVNTAMLNSDSVTSIKIDDGTIVNADINDSAAIAGTKINPNFGSQNTTTTGIAAVGELQVTSTAPKLLFIDSDTNPDYELRNMNGVFRLRDSTNDIIRITQTGSITNIAGHVDVGAGLDVEGATTFNESGADVDFRIEGNGEVNLLFVDASADKIGIGTASPSAKLQIHNTGTPNSQLLRLVNTQHDTNAGSSAQLKFGITNSVGERNARIEAKETVGNTNDVALDFYTNTANSIDSETIKMRIAAAGNVGIGTSSPSGLLSLQTNNPNIRFDDSDTNNNGEITLDNTQLRIEIDEDEAVDNSAIKFRIDNSDKAIIDSSGNVGIGTTSPAGKLHISSGTSGDCELVIEADTDNNDENDNARIIFRQDGGSAQSSIGTQSNELVLANSVSTSGGIVFKTGTTSPHTNATERMRIHPGTFQVQIGGTTLINSNPYLTLGQSANSQGNVFHLVNNGTADLKQVFISANKNSRHVGIDVSADNFFIGRDSSVTDFVIDSSGRVGIGTSTPDQKLKIEDSSDLAIHLLKTGAQDTLIKNTGQTEICAATGGSSGQRIVFKIGANTGSLSDIARFTPSGLCFGSDTAEANALDDYEEGDLTWQLRKHNSPSLGTDNGSVVKYTKVGRMVHISGRIRTDSTGSAGNDNFLLDGTLPFTPVTAGTNPIGHWRSQDDLGIAGSFAWAASSTTVYIYKTAVQNDYAADENNVGAKTQTNLVVTFSLTYQSV